MTTVILQIMALFCLMHLTTACSTFKVQVLDVDTLEPVPDAMVFVESGEMLLLFGPRCGIYRADDKGNIRARQFGSYFHVAAGKHGYWPSDGFWAGRNPTTNVSSNEWHNEGYTINNPRILRETNGVKAIFVERTENPFFTLKPRILRYTCGGGRRPEVGTETLWNQWEAYRQEMKQAIDLEYKKRNQMKPPPDP
jgi:hypothetical protein